MPGGRRGGTALAALATAVFALSEATAGPGMSTAVPGVPLSDATPAAAAPAEEEIQEVKVTAREPRYVAPTLRDRLGRIWAPVYLNGKGPFRLVLDTGASNSAVMAEVATDLGLHIDRCHDAARCDRFGHRALHNRQHVFGGRHGGSSQKCCPSCRMRWAVPMVCWAWRVWKASASPSTS